MERLRRVENEENDETCARGIGEYLRKMQTMYMFVRVRRPVDTDNFVLAYMKCERVFSFEPRYRRLYERLRRVSSVVVKAIETVEQREYRLEGQDQRTMSWTNSKRSILPGMEVRHFT